MTGDSFRLLTPQGALLGAGRDAGCAVQGMVKMVAHHPAASSHPHYIPGLRVGTWGEGEKGKS